MNDQLFLISGKAASGKSAGLMSLKDPEGVMYLNCEGKKLPFKSKFTEYKIIDPLQIYEAFSHAETLPDVHTIIVDSLTYMMDMYESVHVLTAANTMKAWGDYAQFFKNLMSQYSASSTKNVIFTGHLMDVLNEAEMIKETFVKVKGSLMNTGIESYFSCVMNAKKVQIKTLENYGSDLLNITPEEEALGFKYCFQTKLTKDTVNERIRSPLGLFSTAETFIDNDAQAVLDRLHSYYS